LKPEKRRIRTSVSKVGENTMHRVKQEKYVLIIHDLMLPGIQGMELCRIVKSSDDTSLVPIIMLDCEKRGVR